MTNSRRSFLKFLGGAAVAVPAAAIAATPPIPNEIHHKYYTEFPACADASRFYYSGYEWIQSAPRKVPMNG